MSEDWAGIAAEVADAIASVGFQATLLQPTFTGPEYDPTPGPDTEHAVTVIDDQIRKADTNGTTTGTRRILTMAATVTPEKGWRVVVRGQTLRIDAVVETAPGGVSLMFDCEVTA